MNITSKNLSKNINESEEQCVSVAVAIFPQETPKMQCAQDKAKNWREKWLTLKADYCKNNLPKIIPNAQEQLKSIFQIDNF